MHSPSLNSEVIDPAVAYRGVGKGEATRGTCPSEILTLKNKF